MRAEILLSATLLGVPAAVEAQEPTPIVEQVDQLDVTPFIAGLSERVDFNAEPKFFKQLERRAKNNPSEYFTHQQIGPHENRWFYHPDGIDAPPKAAYFDSVLFTSGKLDDGVPTAVPYSVELRDWFIDLGNDGTAREENDSDLFNFDDLEQKAEDYFTEPRVLKESDWSRQTFQLPAYTLKQWTYLETLDEGLDPSLTRGWALTADQNGLLHLSNYERIIGIGGE